MGERERKRGRENDGIRTAWDAHVRSEGRSGAINRSGRFISRRAATAATRFRECSRFAGDLVWNEQLLFIFFFLDLHFAFYEKLHKIHDIDKDNVERIRSVIFGFICVGRGRETGIAICE